MGTICEACSPPREARYAGLDLILARVECNCICPETIFEARGPRCPRCDHAVKIELTDHWEDPTIWINPKTHAPVKLDQIRPNGIHPAEPPKAAQPHDSTPLPMPRKH